MPGKRNSRAALDLIIATVSTITASFMIAATVNATSINSDVFKPLGESSPADIASRLINGVLGLVGVIALIMFIYGGFSWMLSAGNAEKIGKAKQTLLWSAIGLIVVIMAMTIVRFIVGTLGL